MATEDDIDRLQDELVGLVGTARAATLLRLGQVLLARFQGLGPGRPEAFPFLSRARAVLEEAYQQVPPGDPVRGPVAALLGWVLSVQHSLGALSTGTERESGIEALEEALTFPTLSTAVAGIARFALSQLYLSRAVESIRPFTITAASGAADVERAIVGLREVLDDPSVGPELIAAAHSLLTVAEALRNLLPESDGRAPEFNLSRMMDAVAMMQRLRTLSGNPVDVIGPLVERLQGEDLDPPRPRPTTSRDGTVRGGNSQRSAEREVARAMDRVRSATDLLRLMADPDRMPTDWRRPWFTAAHPSTVRPETAATLTLYIHDHAGIDQVRHLVETAMAGTSFGLALRESALALPPAAVLTIEPVVPGLRFTPERVEVAWTGDVQPVAFEFTADPGTAGDHRGTVDVLLGPLPVAAVPCSFRVTDEAAEPTTATAAAQAFERVFASYAHDDEAFVTASAALYTALGIRVLRDRTELRAGERWENRLRELIDDADVFQLYWSAAAAASSEVEKEWRHALSLTGKGTRFIRPVYWQQPMPPPPAELQPFHFGRIDLGALQAIGAQARDSLFHRLFAHFTD